MDIFAKIKQQLNESNERRNQDFSKIHYLRPGKTTIRILPQLETQKFPFAAGGRHFGLGEKGKRNTLCPKLTADLECPACEERDRLLAASEVPPDDLEAAKGLRPAKKFYFNAIIRGEKENLGPVVLEVCETVWSQIVSCYYVAEGQVVDFEQGPYREQDDGSVIFDFADVNQGRDMIVNRIDPDSGPVKYTTQMREVGSKLGTPQQISQWLKNLENLDEYLPKQLSTYAAIKAMIWGDAAEVLEPEESNPVVEAEENPPPTGGLTEDDFTIDPDTGKVVPIGKSKKKKAAPKRSRATADLSDRIDDQINAN
jgi:hypothetical protein